jgi:hypothetical protein
MLANWRDIARQTQADPVAHLRMLQQAERTLRTGEPPVGAQSWDENSGWRSPVAYRIVTDPQVRAQIRALPAKVLHEFADVMGVLELTPWNENKPDSPMRQWPLAGGRGFVTYLVLDDQDRVDVLNVTWLG